MKDFFSYERTLKLIRKDMFSEYKTLIIWLSSAAGIVIVFSALNILFSRMQGMGMEYNDSSFYFIFYVIFLFPGGFILTSTMFKDVHDKSRNIYWLMLPGSTFEKMLSRLLISSIIYAVALTLVFPVISLVSELFNQLVFGMRHDFFNPFTKEALRLIPYYFVSQSIFFAGAVSYRKHPFAKTILFLTLFQIAVSLVLGLLMRLTFGDIFYTLDNIHLDESDFMALAGGSYETFPAYIKFIVVSARIFFWGLLAPFFYVYSYFKLSEKEVRDGI